MSKSYYFGNKTLPEEMVNSDMHIRIIPCVIMCNNAKTVSINGDFFEIYTLVSDKTMIMLTYF